jgi:tRNA-2-methylthio-N6-dimethylallyladenosine synthase
LIDVYTRLPQLAGHVHLPVQSGSDRVLAAMKRGYSVLEYKSIIRRLRRARPDIAISSDFIVGFPGETDADFEATMQLVEDIGFDAGFSFLYSPRPGTPAAELADTTPHETRLARLQRLQALLAKQMQTAGQKMIGTVQRVLVDGVSKKNPRELTGRVDNNCVINFSGAEQLIGAFVDVVVIAAPHTLRGEIAPVHA